jgi:HSP20 family molecular chaperone IbpA
MHTIMNPPKSTASRKTSAALMPVRTPHYDCIEETDALKVIVFVPGVDASGVEISLRGPDLTVTARKPHLVRVNWQALHLERAQRDYQLRLRLGNGLNYDALSAELNDGRLVLSLPKKTAARSRKVA